MGIKDKNSRINSHIDIKKAPICNNCPAKIYQKENDCVKYGKGNLFPNYIFVLPSEAISNKFTEKYLKYVIEDLVDINVEYITYHPKCIASSPVEGYADYCKQYLFYEIRRLKPKKIIFFGVNIPEELYNKQQPFEIYKLNNLLSIYYGKTKINEFKEKLKQIL